MLMREVLLLSDRFSKDDASHQRWLPRIHGRCCFLMIILILASFERSTARLPVVFDG
jgi:hypothetical protein